MKGSARRVEVTEQEVGPVKAGYAVDKDVDIGVDGNYGSWHLPVQERASED